MGQLSLLGPSYSGAHLSECGAYRYDLVRSWSEEASGTILWIMLNPSTADESEDDPTIRRCMSFSLREKCKRMVVVNLFALRSTDPAALLESADPVGPENDVSIKKWMNRSRLIVAAWGAHKATGGRPAVIESLACDLEEHLWCLGTTKEGHPRHPLYVRSDAPLEIWRR